MSNVAARGNLLLAMTAGEDTSQLLVGGKSLQDHPQIKTVGWVESPIPLPLLFLMKVYFI